MIAPGYEERLRELVAARTGRRMAHAYVRPGCIELVIDCEDWGSGALPHMGPGSGAGSWSRHSSGSWEGRASGQQQEEEEVEEAAGREGGVIGGGGAEAELRGWELAQALQLQMRSGSGSEDGRPRAASPPLSESAAAAGSIPGTPQLQETGGCGSPLVGRRLHSPRASLLLAAARSDSPLCDGGVGLESGPALMDGTATTRPLCEAGGAQAARILSLEPRVLQLPPEGAAGGQEGAPTVLEVVVRGGTGPSASEPLELLVRAEGRYLPATVTRLPHDPTAAAAASTAAADAAADAARRSDVGARLAYRVELTASATRGLRPGIVMCDLRSAGLPMAAAPLLAVRAPDMAAELRDSLRPGQLPAEDRDALLMDLGAWLFHTGRRAQGQGRQGRGGGTAGPAPGPPPAPLPELDGELAERLPLLGRHLLSYARQSGWDRTAECAARLLRYASYLASKSLMAGRLLPLPRASESYLTGPGVFVQEGIVHPLSEPVSSLPLLLLLLSPLRAVANTFLILRAAPSAGLASAALRAVCVSALEAASSLATHLYLRTAYRRRAEAKAKL
ncbi:hypothetical protein GPECTOR_149g24 [Gonium pectorale]|uniref:Uncharacterized protein n=1 Tax=Gonium pectorale TaxID=33097 RepID=A0A150FXR2_GONPE|nr:hypothetical protein GPECTOR_149g24 [Gonium pectorale]|eukprot:KXZ42414.1 hypothetical protein GPECTOR_149g24 [Gonium pectorale]